MKQKNVNYNRSLPPFKKGKITCPVCGNIHHWHCAVTVDDSLALCKNVLSDRQDSKGRYIHRLNNSFHPPKQTTYSAPPLRERGSVEVERVDADHINAVYRTLLEHPILVDSEGTRPPLSQAHADHLLNERGFSDTTIAANRYTSVTDLGTLRLICDDLAGSLELRGVPGFYKQDGRWRLRYYGNGFLVPYRDAQGRITGMQVRLDEGEIRYKWLSSAGKPEGVTSGAPYHFAKPDLARQTGVAFITEGALKADRIAEFTDKACIGLAGVDSFKNTFGYELREALPELRAVEIAYDIDWREKTEVRKAHTRLRQTLRAADLSVTVRLWGAAKGKGFDDFLFNLERNTDDE
jgi:Domain of unknown function (DUF3854)